MRPRFLFLTVAAFCCSLPTAGHSAEHPQVVNRFQSASKKLTFELRGTEGTPT
jgi:hypothetical protein